MDELFSFQDFKSTTPEIPLRPQCDKCLLYKSCKSPKMAVDGEGRKGILILSERPGHDEDSQGIPFVGPTGRDLKTTLRKYGIEVRRDCWLYNAVICKPPETTPPGAVEHCRPNVLRTIKELNPSTIILLGSDAVRSVIGWLWKPKTGPIERWVGWQIPARQINSWVCPNYQPATFFYDDRDKTKEDKDPVKRMDYERYLKAAVELEGRPYPDGPPDYESQIECIHSAEEAARRIAKYTSGTIVYDIETNMKKPHHRESEIVCCSVCWEGQETIAFPWHGPVIAAMRKLLTNPKVKKRGQNVKFEHSWMFWKHGIETVGWEQDAMLTAHMLDPRGGKESGERKEASGITGLKFQCHCLLGMSDYSSHIEPFLHSTDKGGYAKNRIRELDTGELLKYCAYDSLLEWEVTEAQRRRIANAQSHQALDEAGRTSGG